MESCYGLLWISGFLVVAGDGRSTTSGWSLKWHQKAKS